MSLHEIEAKIYDHFQGPFKEIYADLCVVCGDKPSQIAFEIEAVMSHLVVAKTCGDPGLEEENLRKALGHIERAILDSAKILWLEYRGRLKVIFDNDNLRKYCVNCPEAEFVQSFQQAEGLAAEARQSEITNVGRDPLASVGVYYDAAKMLKDALDQVDEDKIQSFKKFSLGRFFRDQMAGLIVGVIAGVIAGGFLMLLTSP